MLHRFIPAYAGNSDSIEAYLEERSVHPRLRGELFILRTNSSITGGSSPLTRGTPPSRTVRSICLRFIPAYAGNSNSAKQQKELMAVHPRLRGELDQAPHCNAAGFGSSPLTRGTHLAQKFDALPKRFIPAYAGNSDSDSARYGARSVHPRLRGELT